MNPFLYYTLLLVCFTICNVLVVVAFAPRLPFGITKHLTTIRKDCDFASLHYPLHSTPIVIIVSNEDDNENDKNEAEEEEEGEDEPELPDPYIQVASSEFTDGTIDQEQPTSALVTGGSSLAAPTTNMDWGGALGRLRERVEDIETGASQDPSQALFRVMSAETPNQMIGKFVSTANPQVVQAMSGAVSSLLGGLSRPANGVETLVKASGEKIGSLCFQLQMTG
jgi:hypothetical protein